MSKQNKVNPGQYYVAGRLTPDDAARERMKQRRPAEIRATMAPAYAPAARGVSMHAPDAAKADGQIRGTARPSAAAKTRAAAPAKPVGSGSGNARATTPARTRKAATSTTRPAATRKAAAARKRPSTSATTRKTMPAKAPASGRSRK